MKLIGFLSVFLLVTLLSAAWLVNVKPAFAVAANENTWEIKTSMPKGITGGAAAVVDGKIYVIGDTINYQYDPETDTWAAKAPMPTPRKSFGIAVCQNKIFTIGGWRWSTLGGDTFAVNEVYDPDTNKWQTMAPMLKGQYGVGANVVDGEIYMIGGWYANPLSTQVYNVANDSWTTKEPIPYPSVFHASAVSGGKIYIMDRQSTKPHIHSNQIYNPANDSWTVGAPMPIKLSHAAAVATTGANALRRIYVVGGYTGNPLCTATVQVYNPENNTWTHGTPMPTARSGLAVAVVDDMIYAFGGYTYHVPGADYTYSRNDFNEVYTPFGYGTPDPSYVLETTPPQISFLSPLNQTYKEMDVSLNFTVDKALSWTCYSLDGQTNTTITENITLTGLSSGLHNIIIYANDTYGNVGVSETITFNVEQLFPTTWVITGSTASALLISAGLLVYFKKHKHQGKAS